MEDFDEFGNFIGQEYSESEASDAILSEHEDDVEYLNQQHPTQSINEPLVKRRAAPPLKETTPSNWKFHQEILKNVPSLIRNVAFVGHCGHGKSSIFSWLTTGTSNLPKSIRGSMTFESTYHSVLAQDTNRKSYALNCCDTPGHRDFEEDINRSLLICDGVVLVVDVVEGLFDHQYPLSKPPNVVVINKLDRLILDLRLPPNLAYNRIKLIMDEVTRIYPNASIVFASAKFEFSFTLDTVSKLYEKYQHKPKINSAKSFITLVLTPIYKLFSCGLIASEKSQQALHSIGIRLTNPEWQLSTDDRIRLIMARYLETSTEPLVNEIIANVESPSIDEEIQYVKNIKIGTHEFTLGKGAASGYVPLSDSVCSAEVGPGSWFLIPKSHFSSSLMNCKLAERLYMVGIEPIDDAPKYNDELTHALQALKEFYPDLKFVQTTVGEFNVYGTGELYLDFMLRELRNLVNFKLRVSQPVAVLKETVSEASSIGLPTKTPAGDCVVVIAQPHDAQSVLLCEFNSCKLYSDVDESICTEEVLPLLVEGFKWSCARGPLMESPLHSVSFRITELDLVSSNHYQLSALMQRACYAAFLVASPRIVEPILTITVVGRLQIGKALYGELEKRGGGVITSDKPIYGTNLYTTEGSVPLMDSFGLELDVLCQLDARDLGNVFFRFNKWSTVDGDPLDDSLAVPRLEAADDVAKARDYMVKIRRRKGLVEEPKLERYVDEDVKLLLF